MLRAKGAKIPFDDFGASHYAVGRLDHLTFSILAIDPPLLRIIRADTGHAMLQMPCVDRALRAADGHSIMLVAAEPRANSSCE